MKINFLTKTKHLLAFLAMGIMGCAFVGCSEDIDQSNRYTFTGETITDYLENRPEQFSKFCYILDRAKIGKSTSGSILKTLSTYGSYTCFAPINSAIDEYLLEQYTIWETTKGTEDEEDTGIYSPYIEELSDSMATVIAKNHIIETAYFTTDIKSDGAFPSNNINNRITSINFDNDELGNLVVFINGNAKVLSSDIETENGIVHTVDKVVAPSNKMICDHFEQYKEFSIHSDLITRTGLDEKLRIYELDPEYDKYQTSDAPMSTSAAGTKAPYPESYYQKYTLLAVPNQVYEELGLDTFEKLEEYAERWYGDQAKGDYKNPQNAINKLIAYHIIDRELLYDGNRTGGFVMDGYVSQETKFKSNDNLPKEFNRYDYFETLQPFTTIKATRPRLEAPLAGKLVLNYAQEDGTKISNEDMAKHINAIVLTEAEAKDIQEGFSGNTTNGYIWVIDRLLIYNEDEMAGNVLYERMRWDASSLFPELTNNNVRWHQRKAGFYEIYIPDGFCKRLRINNKTTYPFYLTPNETGVGGWANYQGDELLIDGQYNFEYRLPHLPEGVYEIRFGFGFSSARGICQFYLDKEPQGIPVDMFLYGDGSTAVGKTSDFIDSKFDTEDEIDEFDKSLRNRGWMKGPASVILDAANGKSMRESSVAYRRIVTQTFLSGGEEHWLGFKDVTKGSTNLRQCSQDYLEIVPRGIITDLRKPEDKN